MRRIAVLLIIILFATSAEADELLTADELIERLAPQDTPPLSREFSLTKGVTIHHEENAPVLPPSVDLEISFEFNSAELTTDAMLALDQLGQALNNPALASFRFQVAGHTDGIGSDSFNQTLSERRAAAVCDYLISRHGIATERLAAIGYGKSQLRDQDHPEAAINRRVQVTNIGD